MSYIVPLEEVYTPYYAYISYAIDCDYVNRRTDQVFDYSVPFADRWLTNKGITPRTEIKQGKVVHLLEFKSRAHYIMWVLRWSWRRA